MGEKFNEVQRYYQGLWVVGSPVFLNRSRLLSNASHDIFILNEMINVGKTNISNVVLKIVCIKNDKPMAVYESCSYSSLDVPRLGVFGGKKLFKILPDTQSIEVYVKSVTMTDGTVWNNDGNHMGVFVENAEQILQSDDNYEYVVSKCNEIGIVPKIWAGVFDNGWRCTCSQLNRDKDEICSYCGVSRDWVLANVSRTGIRNMMSGYYEDAESFEEPVNALDDEPAAKTEDGNTNELPDSPVADTKDNELKFQDTSEIDTVMPQIGDDMNTLNDESTDSVTATGTKANSKSSFGYAKDKVVNDLFKMSQDVTASRKGQVIQDEVYDAIEKERKRQEEFVQNMDDARKNRYMAQQEAVHKYNEEMRQKDRYKKSVIFIIAGGIMLCFLVMFLRVQGMRRQNAKNTQTTAPISSEVFTSGENVTTKPTQPVIPNEKPTETEMSSENVTEMSSEIETEKVTEEVTQKPAETSAEKPTEKATEKPVETTAEKPTEKPTEKETVKPDAGSDIVILFENINTATKASQLLYDAGLIDSVEGFNKYLNDNGLAAKVREGSFTFKAGMSYAEIAAIIAG